MMVSELCAADLETMYNARRVSLLQQASNDAQSSVNDGVGSE